MLRHKGGACGSTAQCLDTILRHAALHNYHYMMVVVQPGTIYHDGLQAQSRMAGKW
jgi:hypothetical protein